MSSPARFFSALPRLRATTSPSRRSVAQTLHTPQAGYHETTSRRPATTRSTDAASRRPLGGCRSSLVSADRSSVADGVAAAAGSCSHARRAA